MNDTRTEICNSLSDLLKYPDDNYIDRVDKCYNLLKETRSPAHPLVKKFNSTIKEKSVEELQELFTRTFDLNPLCALEVGWHIYGESYERGAFIVKMRQTLKKLEIVESTELPDHLSYILEALGLMEQTEAKEFSSQYILPALEKMQKGLKDKVNPYESVLRAISNELQCSFAIQPTGVENG